MHNRKLLSHRKKNEIIKFTGTWIELEKYLSEYSSTRKTNIVYIYLHMDINY